MTNEEWEDWYEILGVDPETSEEEIKKAYRGLAKRLHSDHLGNRSESTRRWAEEKFKKINRAYEVLGNPQKRQQYDAKWCQRSIKPKPVVKPQYVQFDDIDPGKIQTSSFVIRNVGGPYKKIWISNPDSWVRIVRYFSLTDSDELPLQVEIEVEGEEWGKSYIEYIRVKLDEEETQVKVELQTKPEPVREKVRVGARPRTRPTYKPYTPPPTSTRQGMPAWGKWFLGLAILGIIVGLAGQFWSSSTSTASHDTHQTISPSPIDTPPDPPIEEYPPVKYSNTRETLDCSFDGGKTWETLLSVRNMPGYWNVINSFVVRNSQHIIVFLRGHVNAQIETVDEGKTWEYIIYHGRYYGSETVKLQTQDRGETWKKVNIQKK